MKTFTYNNDLYIRCIPGKGLFKSTMVHEVVNRGDIFALRVRDQMLTIVPGKAEVEHSEMDIVNLNEYMKRPPLSQEVKELQASMFHYIERSILGL